jgi:hypothetical protein
MYWLRPLRGPLLRISTATGMTGGMVDGMVDGMAGITRLIIQ